MPIFEKSSYRHRILRLGGNDVLRTRIRVPVGETPAERHGAALVAALSDFAGQTLAPAILAKWRENGRPPGGGLPVYTVEYRSEACRDGVCLVLSALLEVPGEAVVYREGRHYFTADGRFQVGRLKKAGVRRRVSRRRGTDGAP